MSLVLEIVEGPGAGRQVELRDEIVVGRSREADVVLGDDAEVSRRHVRITAAGPDRARVEDLGSANGTFLNGEPVHTAAEAGPGDTLVVGVTVLELRSARQVAEQPSAVHAVPPALAVAARRPTYTDPDPGAPPDRALPAPGLPSELESLRDARVRAQARAAPLAVLALAALVVAVYLAAK